MCLQCFLLKFHAQIDIKYMVCFRVVFRSNSYVHQNEKQLCFSVSVMCVGTFDTHLARLLAIVRFIRIIILDFHCLSHTL